MDRNEILQKLKKTCGVARLKLPSHIGIEEKNDVVTLTLKAIEGKSAHGVTANMQQDDAAFEGWAACIRAVVPNWKICLRWDAPENTNNGHYQRFLYRVIKFESYFGDWFSIAEGCSTQASRIEASKTYQLNLPSTKKGESRTNDATHSPENLIENTIYKEQSLPLRKMFQICKIERQLPVGVFQNTVTKTNSIFTHGKSAVDLWGINPDQKELILFELKAPGNEKIGAISELFFYAMVLADEQKMKFVRDHEWGLSIQSTTSLKAMLLAEKIHPLIRDSVFTLLNKPFKKEIQFGYVKMPIDINLAFEKVF
jgi:hypothetical protein